MDKSLAVRRIFVALTVTALLLSASLMLFQNDYAVYGAYSEETSSLEFESVDTNYGLSLNVSGWQIFATDKKILFYDDEVTTKTFTLTPSLTPYGGSYPTFAYSVAMMQYSSTEILVAMSYVTRTYYGSIAIYYWYTTVDFWLINVNSLSYSQSYIRLVSVKSGSGYTQRVDGDLILLTVGEHYYAIVGAKITGSNPYGKCWSVQYYPTSLSSTVISTTDPMLYGSTLVIPHQSDDEQAYIVTRNSASGTTYRIFRFNEDYKSLTHIGTGSSGHYGGFIYFCGYFAHTIYGTEYYDLLIGYHRAGIDETVYASLIRFSDSSVTEDRVTISVSSIIEKLRVFSMLTPDGVTGEDDLTNGYYGVTYVGSTYALKYTTLLLNGLETADPTLSYSTESAYQSKTHYYNYSGSDNIGGWHPTTSEVGLYIDYDEGDAIAETFTANPLAYQTYSYKVTVTSDPEINADFYIGVDTYQTPDEVEGLYGYYWFTAQYSLVNASTGYVFDYWLVNGATQYEDIQIQLLIVSNTTLEINYEEAPLYQVDVESSPEINADYYVAEQSETYSTPETHYWVEGNYTLTAENSKIISGTGYVFSHYSTSVGDEVNLPFQGGSGTEESPYWITKIEHLYNVRDNLNAHFVMLNDLDFEDDDDYYDTANKTQFITGYGWNPIGEGWGTGYFNGTFNGNGYSISNLFLDYTVGDWGEGNPYHVGLFGWISEATVKNLALIDANVTIGSHGYQTTCAGALTGALGLSYYGGGFVHNCSSTGFVTGGMTTGGLIGRMNSGNVTRSFSTCTVEGGVKVGGLIGRISLDSGQNQDSDAYIEDCHAGGNVTGSTQVGGLIGSTGSDGLTYDAEVNDCYAYGLVTNSSSYGGGLIGYRAESNYPVVNDCFYDTTTTNQTTSDGGTGHPTYLMQDFDTYDSAGWDIAEYAEWAGETWYIHDGTGYPQLAEVDHEYYGDVYYDRTTEFDIDGSITITINYDIVEVYYITLSSEPEISATFSIDEEDDYTTPDEVAITEGEHDLSITSYKTFGGDPYVFEAWNIDGENQTDNPLTDYNIIANLTIIAYYNQQEYVYTLYGVYNETTGLIEEGNCTVTVYFNQEDTPNYEFTFNTTYTYLPEIPVRYFHFELGDNDREYWVEPNEILTSIYVFNDTLTDYTINFLDFCGALEDSPYVSAQFYINGTLMTMDKRKADDQSSVSMSLVNTRKYVIKLSGSGTTYTWGDLLMTDQKTVQLILKAIDFPKAQELMYAYLRVYAFRTPATPTGTITVYYEDTKSETVTVDVSIDYVNGTNAYNITETSDLFQLVWDGASNDTTYLVTTTVQHESYGEMDWKQILSQTYNITESPFSLDFLGDWSVFGIDSAVLLPSLLIICAGGCFSVLNAQVGAILTTITAIILTVIGFISIGLGALVVAFALSILMALIYAKRRVRIY